MPSICSVAGCPNKGNKNSGVSFFTFPKDTYYCELWRKVCKNKNVNVKNARICSVHFRPESYREKSFVDTVLNVSPKNSRKLRRDAVPTENLLEEQSDPAAEDTPPAESSASTSQQAEGDRCAEDLANTDDYDLPSISAFISKSLSEGSRRKRLQELAMARKRIDDELKILGEENIEESEKRRNDTVEIQRLRTENENYFVQLLELRKSEAFWRRSCHIYKKRAECAEARLNVAMRLRNLNQQLYAYRKRRKEEKRERKNANIV